MNKLVTILTAVILTTGCSPIHFPVMRTGSVGADMYGVSLHIPFPPVNKKIISSNKGDRFAYFIMNSQIQFEYTNRLSDKCAYSLCLAPAIVGISTYIDYNYRISKTSNGEFFLDPFISGSISLAPGLSFGINSYFNKDEKAIGLKYIDAYVRDVGGGEHDFRGIGPFLTISDSDDNFNNIYEILYLYKIEASFRNEYNNIYFGYKNIYLRK